MRTPRRSAPAEEKSLLDQWVAQLSVFLGIEPKEIGQIGAGKRAPTARLDVAMIQSLVRKDSVADLVAGYGQVIVDECHHLPAVSFERVLSEVKARYPVFSIDATTQAGRRPFEHRLVVRETAFHMPGPEASPGIQEIYAALARDEMRNQMILNDVICALEDGRSPTPSPTLVGPSRAA
jgi:hypothetical protein